MASAAATNEPLRTLRAGTRHANCPANQGRIANFKISGGGGIRTRVAGLPQSCFQDSRLRPLGHPSAKCASNAPYQYWNGGESGQGSGVYFAMEAMKNILRRLRPRWIPAGGGKRLQDWYRRFNLDSVRINVGVASANISFSDADRDAAWELYIEMLTRIVTQPLPREVGDEQTALDSVYALFGITREILASARPRHHSIHKDCRACFEPGRASVYSKVAQRKSGRCVRSRRYARRVSRRTC